MSDPHSVTRADLPEGWACMSVHGYAIGGTKESLSKVAALLDENSRFRDALQTIQYTKQATQFENYVQKVAREALESSE